MEEDGLEAHPQSELEKAAVEASRTPLLKDFWFFLRQNKKWWMLPLAVLLLAFGVLMVLSSTGAAPFIYTLF